MDKTGWQAQDEISEVSEAIKYPNFSTLIPCFDYISVAIHATDMILISEDISENPLSSGISLNSVYQSQGVKLHTRFFS